MATDVSVYRDFMNAVMCQHEDMWNKFVFDNLAEYKTNKHVKLAAYYRCMTEKKVNEAALMMKDKMRRMITIKHEEVSKIADINYGCFRWIEELINSDAIFPFTESPSGVIISTVLITKEKAKKIADSGFPVSNRGGWGAPKITIPGVNRMIFKEDV